MVAGRLNDLNEIDNFAIEVFAQGVSKYFVMSHIYIVHSSTIDKQFGHWWYDVCEHKIIISPCQFEKINK